MEKQGDSIKIQETNTSLYILFQDAHIWNTVLLADVLD